MKAIQGTWLPAEVENLLEDAWQEHLVTSKTFYKRLMVRTKDKKGSGQMQEEQAWENVAQ